MIVAFTVFEIKKNQKFDETRGGGGLWSLSVLSLICFPFSISSLMTFLYHLTVISFAATSNTFSANDCLNHQSWFPRVTNLFVVCRSTTHFRSFRFYPEFLGWHFQNCSSSPTLWFALTLSWSIPFRKNCRHRWGHVCRMHPLPPLSPVLVKLRKFL